MTDPVIRIRSLKKSYDGLVVLNGVDLDVARGEVLCLIGPSGSGKTSLLRCLNQLEPYDSGVIEINGQWIGRRVRNGRVHALSASETRLQRLGIGMVFQNFNLFPHMSVLDNIIFAPMRVLGQSRQEARSYAGELLAKVGLDHVSHALPETLSGGQQQRAAIARALAMRPEVMLFDEPTSALDPELVGEVLDVIGTLAAAGMTMILVTHELEFARDAATKVAFLEQGRIVEHGGAQDVFFNPASERLKGFLRRFQVSAKTHGKEHPG